MMTVGKLRQALAKMPDDHTVVLRISFTRDEAEDEGLAEGYAVEVRSHHDIVVIAGAEDADVAEEAAGG